MDITYVETLKEKYIYIDTRTPKEFEEDHIPGAINLPIFSNEERAVIGTLYKKDKDAAFDLGYNYFNDRIIEITNKIEGFDKSDKIIIYCWRGGMRSKAITDVFCTLGYDALQLKGGYKSYREWVRNQFDKMEFPKLIVIHGLTGSGKTNILKKLKGHIDLEGLAQHRSSIYGAIGLKPRTQKMFESLLLKELMNVGKIAFIEGESKRVGKIHIPERVFTAMKKGIKVSINVSIEERSKIIVDEYFRFDENEKLKNITMSLKEALGKKAVLELCENLDKGEYFEFTKYLLENYYDPKYNHNLSKMEYDFVLEGDFINQLEQIKDKFINTI